MRVETWGDLLKIKKLGVSTFYVVRKDTGVSISPDFTERHLARSWIKKNWEDIYFEITVLNK